MPETRADYAQGMPPIPCEELPGPQPVSLVMNNVARLTAHQRRIFDLIAESSAGLTVGELATLVGSHGNTVRGHIDVLEERQLVRSTTRLPAGRGRPSRVYQARATTPHLPVEYLAGLVRALVGSLAGDDGAARALGRTWATDLVNDGRVDVWTLDPLRELESLLARMGCAPRRCPGGGIILQSCPFMDPGAPLPVSMCVLHEGAVEALVDAMARNRPALGITGVELVARTGQGCMVRLHADQLQQHTPRRAEPAAAAVTV